MSNDAARTSSAACKVNSGTPVPRGSTTTTRRPLPSQRRIAADRREQPTRQGRDAPKDLYGGFWCQVVSFGQSRP
jgi:hypothetical protein